MRAGRADVGAGAAGAVAGLAGVVLEDARPAFALAAAVLGAALALYRTRPVLACAVALVATAALVPEGALRVTTAVLFSANGFAMGRWARDPVAPVAGVLLLAGVLTGTAIGRDAGVPATFVVATTWAAGRAIRERDLVAQRLSERAAELDREREAYAALSVRYERARIASELHDIVAHAISVMVVQAGAGQRLAAVDPALTAETFEAIAEAARQGEQDMGRLVALLSDDEAIAVAPDLTLVEDLIARAAGTGLDVRLRLEGSPDGVPAEVAETAFRIVRESLTNALRYAAGAPVEVVLRDEDGDLVVEVVNGPAPRAEGLAGHGTGNGLRGLREHLAACGGRLQAGPWGDGGWRVAARVPRVRRPSASPSR